jgi:hypothetical protein
MEAMQARGKVKMVCLIALTRKWIVQLNAKMRDEVINKKEIAV